MQKIIFLDIDRTLFDTDLFLNNFYDFLINSCGLSDTDLDEIKALYKEVNLENGYFSPNIYTEKVRNSFPALRGKIEFFFKPENLDKYIYEDAKVLFEISGVMIGVFSKGDDIFQRQKLSKFESVLDPKNIYVFSNKIEHLGEVIKKYKDRQIYLVDDEQNVLSSAKALGLNIKTIMIDRKKTSHESQADFKIESLSDIIPILNETNP